jgi:hypothetical protein
MWPGATSHPPPPPTHRSAPSLPCCRLSPTVGTTRRWWGWQWLDIFSFFILSWDLKDGVVAVILESARVVRYGLLCLGLSMVSWVGLMLADASGVQLNISMVIVWWQWWQQAPRCWWGIFVILVLWQHMFHVGGVASSSVPARLTSHCVVSIRRGN